LWEYIATAAKLQVGTGAPLFQMIGAFFAMFASDNEHIALVNMTSVVSSTILFPVLVFVDDFEKLISRIAAQIKRGQSS
jgi:hypothetical protein